MFLVWQLLVKINGNMEITAAHIGMEHTSSLIKLLTRVNERGIKACVKCVFYIHFLIYISISKIHEYEYSGAFGPVVKKKLVKVI